MVRFCVWLLLAAASFATWGRAEAQDDKSPAGVSLGGALWAEIGGADCSTVDDPTSCTTGVNPVFYGGLAAFDLDLLHWLRVGLTSGIGYAGSEEKVTFDGERKTARHWFVPLTLHTYWRVELGKRVTLWGGPELGAGIYLLKRTIEAPLSMVRELEARTAFVAGLAIGVDLRLSGSFRVGVELGESVQVKPAHDGDPLDLRAMTRFALVLRYL